MSETTPEDFIHELPTDKMQIPPGIDVQSLIPWSERFRANVKAVVHGTANNLQAFMAIMAREKATHYASHQVIRAMLLELWCSWLHYLNAPLLANRLLAAKPLRFQYGNAAKVCRAPNHASSAVKDQVAAIRSQFAQLQATMRRNCWKMFCGSMARYGAFEPGTLPRLWFEIYILEITATKAEDDGATAVLIVQIPSIVLATVTISPLRKLQPLAGIESRHLEVAHVPVAIGANSPDPEGEVRAKFSGKKGVPSLNNCIFRGIGNYFGTQSSLRLLFPFIKSESAMELGPGIYTTPELGVALNYAGPNGAIMVFKDTNFQGLAMYNLVDTPEEWRAIINANARRSLTDAVVLPEEYHQAEVITGAISENFDKLREAKGIIPCRG